jgi:hypothetical protein
MWDTAIIGRCTVEISSCECDGIKACCIIANAVGVKGDGNACRRERVEPPPVVGANLSRRVSTLTHKGRPPVLDVASQSSHSTRRFLP